MIPEKNSILILARGNELLGDEGVTLKVARMLQQHYQSGFDVDEVPLLNISLLESMAAYDKVLLLDAIKTGDYTVGSVVPFSPELYTSQISRSPQYTGLPDLMNLAKLMEMELPSEIRILAMEIPDSPVMSEVVSERSEAVIPQFIEQVKEILHQWGCSR